MSKGKGRVERIGLKPFQRKPVKTTTKFEEHFVLLHRTLTRSPAWLSLSAIAKVLYQDMLDRYDGHNDLNIRYKQDECTQIMDRKSFQVKRDELLTAGFIEYVEYHRSGKLCNVYKFSSKWHNYVPPEGAIKEKFVSRKRNYLKAENGTLSTEIVDISDDVRPKTELKQNTR